MNEIGLSLDTVWMLLAAMLVFWMQPGFALCEAGFTRSKNTANILMKNFVDFMFGSLLFFFLGFGFMFGSDGAGFIGAPNWGDLSFYKGDLPVEGFLIFETVLPRGRSLDLGWWLALRQQQRFLHDGVVWHHLPRLRRFRHRPQCGWRISPDRCHGSWSASEQIQQEWQKPRHPWPQPHSGLARCVHPLARLVRLQPRLSAGSHR